MVNQIKNIACKFSPFVYLIGLTLLSSCDTISDPPQSEDINIPVYKLSIGNEDYGTFVTNEFSDLSVNGKLYYENDTYNVEIEHHGFSSRGLFKKNYSLEFKKSDPLINRMKVILSGQATDPSMLRAFLSAEIFREAGLKTFNIQPVFFYINEDSQGLYYLIEPINEEFFSNKAINVGELYKAINGDAKFSFQENKELRYGFEKRIPKDDNYYTLEKLITTLDNEPGETFETKVESLLNVDAYLKYMAISVMICNWDGLVHNFYLYKDATTGLYEVIPWDLDVTFILENSLTSLPGSAVLLTKLLQFQKYRDIYKKHFENYLNGCFSESSLYSKIDNMKNTISKAYSQDRWLKTKGYDLNTESEKIKNFIKQRRQYIQEQLNNFE